MNDWDPELFLFGGLLTFLLGFGATFAVAYATARRRGGLSRLPAGALAFVLAIVGGVLLGYVWVVIGRLWVDWEIF